MMTSSTPPNRRVIVLGDHDTGQRADALTMTAGQHGAAIIEVHTFDQGAAASSDSLAEIDAAVIALSRAIVAGADIWVPYPMPDLGQEQHSRRLSLVLQRHGVNLRMGPHLWPCPTVGGMNEADLALRREVQYVDELDHAAMAAAGFQSLGREIEAALTADCTPRLTTSPADQTTEQLSEKLDQLELQHGPKPRLPATTAAWSKRRPALKRYATWLVHRCGLTQTNAAKFINASGHRTPQGRIWQQATISALINGRYDHPAAA
jgi:hypothetical protein